MNEQELKDLWKSADLGDIPEIDFENLQKNIDIWHGKLRRRLIIDLWFTVPSLLVFIPAAYIAPEILYYFPIVALFAVWLAWRVWKIYKLESTGEDSKDTAEYLKALTSKLSNYIKWVRIVLYSTMPFFALSTLYFNWTHEQVLEHSLRVSIILLLAEIFAVAFCEIYFRIMYFPSLRKSRELINQLENGEFQE